VISGDIWASAAIAQKDPLPPQLLIPQIASAWDQPDKRVLFAAPSRTSNSLPAYSKKTPRNLRYEMMLGL